MLGRYISRYRITELLGSGGMSFVYGAIDTSLDREVAVKVLHPHLASREEARQRFSREARAVARLRHPHIVEVYDYAEEGAQGAESYIVTELIRGLTLRDFQAKHAFHPPEAGALLVCVLADALAHAHSAEVIHRDLKPENVMIRSDGVLKLMDFGIAKVLDRDDGMTMTGALVGSPAHMAPEIIEGHEATVQSDLWSLGTILYWLCCGRLPFTGGNSTQTLKNILDGNYPDPRLLNPALSDTLAALVIRCLAHQPEARFASAAALRDELAAYLATMAIERPSEESAAFLRAPEEWSARYRTRLLATLQERARRDSSKGSRNYPKALAAIEHILALEPGHEGALALLTRLQRRRRRLTALSVALPISSAGALLLFAISTGGDGPGEAQVAREEAATIEIPSAPVEEAELSPAPLGETSLAEVAMEPTRRVPPTAEPEPLQRRSSKAALPVVALGRAESAARIPSSERLSGPQSETSGERRVAPAAAPQEEPSARAPARHAELSIIFSPRHFAKIFLDGIRMNTNGAPTYHGNASVGTHLLKIESPYCFPYERKIEVREGIRNHIEVHLARRPATLAVLSEHKEALVLINGSPRGSVLESQAEPIVMPIPEDQVQASFAVQVFPKGARPETRSITIRGGERAVLDMERAR